MVFIYKPRTESAHAIRALNEFAFSVFWNPMDRSPRFDMSKRLIGIINLWRPSWTDGLHSSDILRNATSNTRGSIPLKTLEQFPFDRSFESHVVTSKEGGTFFVITRGTAKLIPFPLLAQMSSQVFFGPDIFISSTYTISIVFVSSCQ